MKKTLIIFVMFLVVSSLCAAEDMYAAFVKFDGIPSELEAMGTSGWIALVGFEIGVAQDGGVISKPVISFTSTKIVTPELNSIEGLSRMSLACVKEMDAISPKIASAFNQRIKIPDAKLCLCSVKNLDQPLKEYHMFDVLISKHGLEDNQETLVVNFEKISEIK